MNRYTSVVRFGNDQPRSLEVDFTHAPYEPRTGAGDDIEIITVRENGFLIPRDQWWNDRVEIEELIRNQNVAH